MNPEDSIKHRQPEEERPKVTATRFEILAAMIIVLGIFIARVARPDVGLVLALLGFILLFVASLYRFRRPK